MMSTTEVPLPEARLLGRMNATAAVDPVVALLVATAVGFVEAGFHAGATSRLRDFANGDADILRRACALTHIWPYISPDARAAALRLLTVAAGSITPRRPHLELAVPY